MSDPIRILIVAEGTPDAALIRGLVEKLVIAEHDWIRDHREAFGDLTALVSFEGPDGAICLTHRDIKTLAEEHRIRLTGRGEAAATRLVRKCVAVCRTVDPDAPVIFHHDAEDLSGASPEEVRAHCATFGVVVAALPDPCTESWVLLLAGKTTPTTCREAKQAVGDHGLVASDVLDAADLAQVGARSSGLRPFLDDAGRALVPVVARGRP